jgi:hypothetical protein
MAPRLDYFIEELAEDPAQALRLGAAAGEDVNFTLGV